MRLGPNAHLLAEKRAARVSPWLVVHFGHVLLAAALWLLCHSGLYRNPLYQPWKWASTPLLFVLALAGWIPLRRAVRGPFAVRRYPYALVLALLRRRFPGRRRRPAPRTYWRHRAVRSRWLLLALKAYFLPLVFGSLCHGVWNLLGFRGHLASAALCVGFVRTGLFVIDSCVAAAGYTWEGRRGGAPIVAVETSLTGWFFCLVCYPPANRLPGALLSLRVDPARRLFPADSAAAVAADAAAALLLIFYVAGIVAQGLRVANLTYRSTVAGGPYAVVRHPQYAAKLASWFFEWLPYFASPVNVVCFLGWVGVYVARTLTEERFLARFPDYRAYCARVRWRFIPGVW